MVSAIGGNVWDDIGCDDNVISTAMDIVFDDTGYGTDVYVCGGIEGDM